MSQSTHIINQVLPILILLALGNVLGRVGFLTDRAVEDLKRIVVNLALPAVLFLSFLEIELKPAYLALFPVVPVVCFALYFVAKAANRILGVGREYFPFLGTGFEYGMMGVCLFGSAYGVDSIGYIAVVDLGHEFFIWFVFAPMLMAKRDGAADIRALAAGFCKNPIIIAIVAGIGLNALVEAESLSTLPVVGAGIASLEFLAAMTIPLILIIVGQGIRIRLQGLGKVLVLVGLRLGVCIPLALALNAWLIRSVLGLGRPFEIALFTLLVMPSPFIIPLFMKRGDEAERNYVNNVLAVGTLASIVVFVAYFSLNPNLG